MDKIIIDENGYNAECHDENKALTMIIATAASVISSICTSKRQAKRIIFLLQEQALKRMKK